MATRLTVLLVCAVRCFAFDSVAQVTCPQSRDCKDCTCSECERLVYNLSKCINAAADPENATATINATTRHVRGECNSDGSRFIQHFFQNDACAGKVATHSVVAGRCMLMPAKDKYVLFSCEQGFDAVHAAEASVEPMQTVERVVPHFDNVSHAGHEAQFGSQRPEHGARTVHVDHAAHASTTGEADKANRRATRHHAFHEDNGHKSVHKAVAGGRVVAILGSRGKPLVRQR